MSQLWDKNSDYKYFGRGLNEGECGISIQKVQASNNGKVECALGLAEDEVSGEVDLTVACKYRIFLRILLDGAYIFLLFHFNI